MKISVLKLNRTDRPIIQAVANQIKMLTNEMTCNRKCQWCLLNKFKGCVLTKKRYEIQTRVGVNEFCLTNLAYELCFVRFLEHYENPTFCTELLIYLFLKISITLTEYQ